MGKQIKIKIRPRPKPKDDLYEQPFPLPKK